MANGVLNMDGKEITAFRERCGISQEKMAADLGVSQSRISEYEKDKRPIPLYFEKHFTLYTRLSTFTGRRAYDGIEDEFENATNIIKKARTRQDIEQAIGAMLVRGIEGKRWRSFMELTRLIERYRKLLRLAAKKVREIERRDRWAD